MSKFNKEYVVFLYSRSGSVDMMKTCGQTDFTVASNYRKSSQDAKIEYQPGTTNRECLVCCPERESRRPDGDIRRKCLTSIIWMPVLKSPVMRLSVNMSDHVLYWQGETKLNKVQNCPAFLKDVPQ